MLLALLLQGFCFSLKNGRQKTGQRLFGIWLHSSIRS